MYGYGRGRGGRGFVGPVATPPGYRYVGTCRCGFGPHAYYQNAQGQIVGPAAAWSIPSQPASALGNAEIEQLKAEKAELERRLRELEERLQGQTRG